MSSPAEAYQVSAGVEDDPGTLLPGQMQQPKAQGSPKLKSLSFADEQPARALSEQLGLLPPGDGTAGTTPLASTPEGGRPHAKKQLSGGLTHAHPQAKGRALGSFQRGATKASLMEASEQAKGRIVFNKYSEGLDAPMSYEQFTSMMRAEFDAGGATVDNLWSLDGFCTRTADVSRRIVVTADSFVGTAARLGLFGRRTVPPDARSIPHKKQRCCGYKCCCEFDDVPLVDGKQTRRIPSGGLVDPERHFLLKSGSCGGCLSYWDAWLLFLLMVVTIFIPLRIGFDLPLTQPWLICDIITDLSFISDIILNFIVCYEDEDTMKLVINAEEIRLRYMGTWKWSWGPFGFLRLGWFYYDVMSCLPVTYFQLAMGKANASDAKLARLLRLVRLTKVLKLAKIANLLQRNAESLRDIDGLDVIKAGVMTLIFAHLTACGWHYIGIGKHARVSLPEEMGRYLLSDEYLTTGEAYTWIEAYDETLLNGTLGNKYGTALYFATTTLSTVGYGDILPINEHERLFTAFFQVIGVFTFGYTMGTLSGYIIDGKLDPKTQKYNEMMPKIEAYLKRKKVSKIEQTGTDIKKHFGNVLLHSDSVMDEDLVVNYMRLIDPVMARKVLTQIYQPQNDRSTGKSVVGTYFRVFEPGKQPADDGKPAEELKTANGELLVDLNNQMEPAHDDNGKTSFVDGSEIVREGDIVRGIYVVTQGRCVKSTWECYVRAKADHLGNDLHANSRSRNGGRLLDFRKGDIIAVTERSEEGRWRGYVAWEKTSGKYQPNSNPEEAYEDWTKERAEAVSGEFHVKSADGAWIDVVEPDPFKRPHSTINCLDVPHADALEDWNWSEGELGVGDCFGLHAAMGKGAGKAGHHIRFSVRAKQVEGVDPLKLTFLSLDKLSGLFEKHPPLEKSLRVQVALLDSVSGQPNSMQRRRNMEHAGFPGDPTIAARDYDEVLTEQKALGVTDQQGLNYDSVLRYLDKFHEFLPLAPELQHDERVAMIKSAFDKDLGGDIDKHEFWNGLQVFTDPLKSSKKLQHPPRKEMSIHDDIGADVHRIDVKLANLTDEISQLKDLLMKVVGSK